MTDPKHNEKRLPQWAQHELSRLRVNNEALIREVAMIDARKTRVVQVADYGTPRLSYLRDRPIHFLPEPGASVFDGFTAELDGKDLTVRAPSTMFIVPWATNTIRIRHGEW
jgi:hypothetical protein